MTILLEPEIEARLRERAAHEGQDADRVANTLSVASLLKSDAEKEKAFHQALLASGLVKRIARRTGPDASERQLIKVQGEPVSETILRERR